MKAIILENTGKSDQLKVSQIPIPKIKENHVLVKVNAFGINRSEVILREYEADEDYIKLPIVPGIECVGTIVDSLDDNFKKGDKIISLMGGMGRSFNGSYEEYALLPIKNVFKIDDNIIENFKTEEIATIPETYFTAYMSLMKSLQLNSSDILLIRGATSATGLAAINLAKAINCTIIATTRDNKKSSKLLSQGVDYVVIDDGNISDKIHDLYREGVSKILELVGPNTLKDSMNSLNSHGICCVTGVLGQEEYIDNFDPIKDIPNGKYLTSFFSNYPTEKIINDIFKYILENNIHPIISQVFHSLEDISKAHELMESNNAQGKIIIKLEEL